MEKLPMFTYGILKPEIGSMSYYLNGKKVSGEYTKVPDFCICDAGIALAYYKPGSFVEGYLWHLEELDDESYKWAIVALDRLEAGYRRIIVDTENGTKAWMYVTDSDKRYIEECGCHHKWPTKKGRMGYVY